MTAWIRSSAAVAADEETWITPGFLAALKARDDAAKAEFFRRYFRDVYNYLRLMSGDAEYAEDAAQETMIDAIDAFPRYELRGKPVRVWLFQIARNRARDHQRAARRRDRVAERARGLWPEEDPSADPLLAASETEMLRELAGLPRACREVLFFRFHVGLSHDEIGALLKITANCSRQKQRRALKALTAQLQPVHSGAGFGRRRSLSYRRLRPVSRVIAARRNALALQV